MEKGDLVLVDYVGRSNGEIFDLSNKEKAEEEGLDTSQLDFEPVPVLVGEEYVIPGFEKAVEDMEVGEEKEFTVSPEEGYGERKSEDIETYPEKEFNKQDVQVSVGDTLMVGRRQGRVISKGSGRVRIDFNHPLAGKELDYWVKVVEKVEDDEEKARTIFDYRLGHGEIEFDGETVTIVHKHEDDGHQHELPQQLKDAISREITDYTKYETVEFDE
ncbi:FKBP-type peptidyl-prolyl cis-trans isomerase [Candidatus Nanohalovita haloferacivicina]|uniref:FKBP-type peptidyl-prolyl cis-trans isomerase n=1 Tax=Candidatus Nanohalovita haloferacivicina TaxID=2978046 RepID=UPI00325FB2AE|nr:FKBP-type peptidyl-prolyl cis-trans isomerase SlyD [Candidatus Nanohalobia archaeon BNXNv]